ncbi:MAG: FxsA family protein [Pseudomonadales bacterium]|nr:FxsA family protein [Pseudomonadales bacterium]
MRLLFLAFLLIPVIEMWLLITVGSVIGAWPTIGLVLLTAIIGVALLRQQGVATLFRVNQKMAAGELPAGEIAEGLFLAIGGALLLTPGFFTDFLGFACLIPVSRRCMVKWWLSRFVVSNFGEGTAFYRSSFRHPDSGDVFDAEFSRDITEDQRLK